MAQGLVQDPRRARGGGRRSADVTVRIDAETAEWARQEARASGLPHNEARAVFTGEQLRADLLKELADDDTFTAALDELWPTLTPQTLLAPLYTSPERLRAAGSDQALLRADRAAWTVSDMPLLDELVNLLGRDTPADQTAERKRKDEADYAAGVLDILKMDREDLMDDEDLADHFVERDTRELVERAAADRDWTYRHVVVDEAQELSEMDWRVLMWRCPGRSFTVVGDLAQRLGLLPPTMCARSEAPGCKGCPLDGCSS